MKSNHILKHAVPTILCIGIMCIGTILGLREFTYANPISAETLANCKLENSLYLNAISEGNLSFLTDQGVSYVLADRIPGTQDMVILKVNQNEMYHEGDRIPASEVMRNGEFLVERDQKKILIFTYLYDDKNTQNCHVLILPYDMTAAMRQYEQTKKWRVAGPILCSLFAVVLIQLMVFIRLRKKVYRPVEVITGLADAICKGNYDVNYVSVTGKSITDNEISGLVYSFEMMRDELKEKKEIADRLKIAEQELISYVSHDLKTPLSTIKAYGEGLRDHIAQDEETKDNYVEVILKKTNTMIDMISDLLEYSNASLGQMPMEFQEMYADAFFSSLCGELIGYAKEKGIELSVTGDERNPLLRIDPKRMTQVMYNLIENAMKYKDSEKEIKWIHIAMQSDANGYQICVSDNGIGIESEEILYIFDKFYRSEKSRTSSIPGAGLGLSICKYIMKEHGGDIFCESTLGVGTKFYLILPIA